MDLCEQKYSRIEEGLSSMKAQHESVLDSSPQHRRYRWVRRKWQRLMGILITSRGILVGGWAQCRHIPIRCGVGRTEICVEGGRSLAAESQFDILYSSFMHYKSSFRNMVEAGSVVTYRQFWPGQHAPILLDPLQPHYHHPHPHPRPRCCCQLCHHGCRRHYILHHIIRHVLLEKNLRQRISIMKN